MALQVYIPAAIGQEVPEEVFDGIERQDIDAEVSVIHVPGLVESEGNFSRDRVMGEIAAREALRVTACRRPDDDIVVMQDSDVVHLERDNLRALREAIEASPGLGALALSARVDGRTMQHIPLHCVAIRVSIFRKVQFKDPGGLCTCIDFARQVRQHGRYWWLDGRCRVKEISRN